MKILNRNAEIAIVKKIFPLKGCLFFLHSTYLHKKVMEFLNFLIVLDVFYQMKCWIVAIHHEKIILGYALQMKQFHLQNYITKIYYIYIKQIKQ